MKKISAILFVISLGTTVVNAQKNEVTNAYLGITHYQKEKDPAELAKAKIAIDKATLDAGTSLDPKTWVYRGQIYTALYQKDLSDKMATHKDITDLPKKQSISYYETPTENLVEGTNAFLKAKTLKNWDIYSDDIQRGFGDCYYSLQMAAIQRYNVKEYSNSMSLFSLAVDISSSQKIFDTLNINNLAGSAYNAKAFDVAETNFTKLTDVGYGKGNTWMRLGRAYCDAGDSAKYISTISAGLKKYPNDADLLTEDVNIKMKRNQTADAVNELNALVAQNPNDPLLNFSVGNVYDRMANPDSANGHHAPKPKNYEELLENAAKFYKKAIELDPKNFDANYNLGVLYYNQSVEYYNRSQLSIADAAKYKDMWEKPLPDAAKYLEAAHALNPKDLTTLIALKACYGQMSDNDNYTRIKEEIKKVQAGQ